MARPVFTESDHTRIWEHLNALGVWTEEQLSALLPPVWTAYTPTFSDPSTPMAVGNGTLTGRYCVTGRIVHVQIELQRGSTTNIGAGNWIFGLPPAAPPRSWAQLFGAGTLTGGSANRQLPVTVGGVGVGQVGVWVPVGRVSTTVPGSWSTEALRFGVTYERA